MTLRPYLPSGQVTFLFTDIEASTRMAQALGEEYRPVLHQHRAILRGAMGAYDSAELLTEGDSFFIAFQNASDAVTACVTAQRAMDTHPWPTPAARPRVRMGLHTGHVVPYGGEYASHEVHRAARVASAAHGGQVLCSGATAARAELPDAAWLLDLGLHRLRGFDDAERLYQLVAPGLDRHFPRPRTLGPASHNLPAASTSFVGRARERSELRALISAHRLVTVTGPGGVGKTRLAVEVASDLISAYPDGVWFADFAATSDPALVPVAVAAAFGLRPEPGRPIGETLAEDVSPLRCLLVLDTCEHHRSQVAAVVSQLLAACPRLTVVTTSREPLGLAGELMWRIPPLSLVPTGQGERSDAVELLLDRASAARGGDLRCPDELSHMDRIARRLDGLPLAIELAAARMRVLSASELAERLDDVIGVLDGDTAAGNLDDGSATEGQSRAADSRVGPDWAAADRTGRHRTLTTTVGWSYRTLEQRPARLLRQLAVFAGGVDLAAIEWLLGERCLAPLAVLVDKSLVRVDDGPGRTRYRMLDTIRAYAARKLDAMGEEMAARDRHVAWCLQSLCGDGYLSDAALSDAALSGSALSVAALSDAAPLVEPPVMDSLVEEVRQALHWSAAGGDVRNGLRLAAALEGWWTRGHAREGRVWLFRLYERMAAIGAPVAGHELAAAYLVHARLAGADGELGERTRFRRRAEQAAQGANDQILAVHRASGPAYAAAGGIPA
ncbi:MAG: adenylate/guanylate cyclase domain-containing protein [Micromonosporaceae bacterium]|nr:adenylate/guanylate cyclase domain-containing protein [Micromonosporaceae bacterium]